MKRSIRYGFAAVVLGVSSATAFLVACSSDDNGNTPITTVDSGAAPDVTVTNPMDSSTSTTQDAPSSTPDTGTQTQLDGNLPDVGPCVSDAAVMNDAQVCNSCYTPSQDPLNGCSSATVNCKPFDNSRVPTGAP